MTEQCASCSKTDSIVWLVVGRGPEDFRLCSACYRGTWELSQTNSFKKQTPSKPKQQKQRVTNHE